MTYINIDHEYDLEKRKLLCKIDFHLLPILSILYLLSCLNGSNIVNAKLSGLDVDIHITPEQYQWCLSVYFLGFVIFQIPSNIVLRRWRPSNWISLIAFHWGLASISMAAVTGFKSLLLSRFLLGTFQCGFFPGFIYYMSLWYKRKEQAIRLGFFWSFAALAGAFGGYIAYAIGRIESTRLTQWQLIFIVEGIPTVILAIFCWIYLPDSPEVAHFLTNEQRQSEINRLSEDAGASLTQSFTWSQVLSVFVDWKTYGYATIYMCGAISLQSMSLFLPTIIYDMGNSTAIEAQLRTVPPYIAAFFMILIVARSSDHFIDRSLHIVFTNLLTISGFVILIFVDVERIRTIYFGVILVTCGTYANVCLRAAWINNNFASLTRRAVASALIISIGAIGGFISGQIYNEKQRPRYLALKSIALICSIVQTTVVLSLRFTFMFINRQRSKMTEEQRKKQLQKYGGEQLAGDYHPDFRYTL